MVGPNEQIFNGQTVFTSLKHLSAATHKFRDTNRIIWIRLSLRRFVFWQRQRYTYTIPYIEVDRSMILNSYGKLPSSLRIEKIELLNSRIVWDFERSRDFHSTISFLSSSERWQNKILFSDVIPPDILDNVASIEVTNSIRNSKKVKEAIWSIES